MDKITREDIKVLVPQRQPRRPRFTPSKIQPRSRLMQRSTTKQILRYHSRTNKRSGQDRDGEEEVEPQLHRLSLRLNMYNSILGGIGLVSALCFGVVTVVQADTANKEARIANKIAGKSLFLSWVQTCAQVVDVSNSTLCALVEGYVKDAFWPKSNGTWSTMFIGDLQYLGSPFSMVAERPPPFALYGCSAFHFDSPGFYFIWGWMRPFLLCFSGVVLALPNDRYWEYLLFCWSLIHLDTDFLGYMYPGPTSDDNTDWQLQKRLLAIESLFLLLWFFASGFALRMRNGGDFVTAVMRRTTIGRLSAWDAINCCILELYYLIWLDVMIGFMLQNF